MGPSGKAEECGRGLRGLVYTTFDELPLKDFGAFGAAWDDAMIARWSANPLGMLWPEMDAALLAGNDDGGGTPAAMRRPVVIIAAG